MLMVPIISFAADDDDDDDENMLAIHSTRLRLTPTFLSMDASNSFWKKNITSLWAAVIEWD
jgi:hypothetical protein